MAVKVEDGFGGSGKIGMKIRARARAPVKWLEAEKVDMVDLKMLRCTGNSKGKWEDEVDVEVAVRLEVEVEKVAMTDWKIFHCTDTNENRN